MCRLLFLVLITMNIAVFGQANMDSAYVCPPCNSPCDDSLFTGAGTCPHCKMTLVKKEQAVKPLSIGLLLHNGVEVLDFAGPLEVFSYAGFELFTIGKTKQPITSQGVLTITPEFSIEDAPPFDVLAVFGGNASKVSKDAEMISWIRKQRPGLQYCFSVCTGAYILAEAGFLDSLSATTFHSSIPDFRSKYPAVRVLEETRFVDNGTVITTAGISAGIDGALHFVSKVRGEAEAARIARMMEYDKWKPGEGLILANSKVDKRDSSKKSLPIPVYSSPSSKDIPVKTLQGRSIGAKELSERITKLMSAARVAGLGVTIFNNNRIVFQKAFGYKRSDARLPFSANTNIYGASLSKNLFAVLVMKLVEEGLIELDKPLQSYLPKPVYEYGAGSSWNQDYRALERDSLYREITARMCLNHTSGFPNWRWEEKDETLRVKFKPGQYFSYSGEGLCYLQFVIEKLSGKSLEQLMEEKIFPVLGMKYSAYSWRPGYDANFAYGHDKQGKVLPKDKDNAPRAASTLETTLEDYSYFLQAMLQKKILASSSYAEMFKTQVRIRTKVQMAPESWKQLSNEYDHLKLGYGLGWGVMQTPKGLAVFKEGHGEGFQHYCILFPDQKTGILLMSNSDNAESIFKELLEETIGDTYTPYKWQQYLPYNVKR
ncbi:MAG TPA: serine hydrolase [Flavisolibacter sp.]|nr:serine hydrolase [Flavisolibacter sp.]